MRTRLALLAALAACSGHSKTPTSPTPPPDAAPAASSPDATPVVVAPPAMTLAQAGIVPDWLDEQADPCQDFFQHACGGFVATAQIPADRSGWGAIQVVSQAQENFLRDTLEKAAKAPGKDPVLQRLGDYYAACMNEDAIEQAGLAPVKDLLAAADGVKDFASATAAITTLHQAGIDVLWDIGPTQDFADATQVIAGLDQAGLGLPDRSYYLESAGNMKEVRTAYLAHLERLFGLAGYSAADAKSAASDVLRLETAIARLQQSEVTRRNPRAIYHRVERKGLKKAAATLPWDAYFTALGLGAVTQITVNDPKYFTGIDKLLHAQAPQTLRRYFTAHILESSAPALTKALVNESFEMEKVLSGVKELAPRWRRCVMATDGDLGELLGQPYVAARFPGDAKALATDLVVEVKSAMAAELAALPWMDDATRKAAVAKLDKMDALVGYPDTWRNYDFAVTRGDFAANVRAAGQFEHKRQLAKIGQPVDRNDWGMTPPTVNAYYDPSINHIVLPAGQLQPPFFGLTFHPAVNFGSTGGGTIGHEMTHGFDDEGSQFDADGNLRDWWSKATSAKFKTATTCVQKQYGAYEAVPGVKLNGELTSGENIADIGGVKLAFQAYHAWRAKQATPPPAQVGKYTDDQLYFLAYAQSWCSKDTPQRLETMAHTNPHSPPKWRVNGVIADQPGFAAAFACKAD
ncbi:MAG: M13 family metallopeptidase, partial [Deltaproteobacteria bacterium]|nr:M13 family metallopeptidase [Deltaproteobacteria bacterium]